MKQLAGICFLLGLFLISGLLYGGSVVTLEKVLNPSGMYIDDDQLYVTDSVKVLIYSLKDYSLVTQFGKSGDGPAEFKINPTGFPLFLDVQADDILVSSQNRLSFFSKKGDFIKEKKTEGLLGGSYYHRIGRGYIGMRSIFVKKDVYFGILLFDDKFKSTKEIIRRKHFTQPGKKFNAMGGPMSFQLDRANDQIVIDTNDGNLHLFNLKGEKKMVITPALNKIKVTAEHKKKSLHFFQTDIRVKKYWRFIKPLLEFPDHLPMILGFAASDSKIYIVTSYQKDTSSRILTYDENGKLIQDKYYPFAFKNFLEVSPFVVKNNKIYQLAENEDEEEWELHITNIK